MNQFYRLGPHLVPKIWKHFLPEEFQYFSFPRERFATCSQCPMIKERGFHQTYKCCTHIPRVANFSIGMALDDAKSGPLVKRAIEQGYALPEGTVITPPQARVTLRQNANGDFGKGKEARCDFLDTSNGMCGLYAFRNATCSTFFCRNDFGDVGEEFWELLQGTIGQIEYALSQWAMDEIGIETTAYMKRFDELASTLQNRPESTSWTESERKHLWLDWFGKEEEFFRQAAHLIKSNEERLFDIAMDVPLHRPDHFESAFRNTLPDDLKRELDADAPQGIPESIESLWYRLQLAHRNLWVLPGEPSVYKTAEDLTIQKNVNSAETPWILQKGVLRTPISEREYQFLSRFQEPTAVTSDLLGMNDGDDSDERELWSFFLMLKAKEMLIEKKNRDP